MPIHVERVGVRELAGQWRTSVEDAGRRARYAFSSESPTELGADAIATGHTRDDQAETFLLQLMRGAGPRGLAGIRPQARPHLPAADRYPPRTSCGRISTRRQLPFRDDESNLDPAFTRNRVRHELLPVLEREFSAGIVNVLAREAAIARAGRGAAGGAKQSKWRVLSS